MVVYLCGSDHDCTAMIRKSPVNAGKRLASQHSLSLHSKESNDWSPATRICIHAKDFNMATARDALIYEISKQGAARDWGWMLALGVAQNVAGVLAIATPAIGSSAAIVAFAAALLVSAIFHLMHAFKAKRWPGSVWYILGGTVYGAGALFAIFFPDGGALTLTAVIAAVMLADGALRMLLASSVKRQPRRAWVLAAGISGVVLGALLLTGWPATALWVTGLLLGVNLLFSGASHCMLALTSRNLTRLVLVRKRA
jgi:uncharacterized membrane protein HdeD (DUF308 family)